MKYYKNLLTRKLMWLLYLVLTGTAAMSQEYLYDSNGNLVQDNNQGHQSISYNHLNLVEKVLFKDGGAITYSYDAAGNKLSKTVTDPQGKSTTWYYVGGFEYTNEKQLEFFATEEGRVTRQGEIYNYEYNLKDHLGNTRVSFDKDPTTGKARIIQKDAYYPFGGIQPGNSFASGQQNKYLYNGKELQEELRLYDYGARMQDPWLGRWHVIDPLAEKYTGWSPYNYVLNNPMRLIDPDGREPFDPSSPTPIGPLPPLPRIPNNMPLSEARKRYPIVLYQYPEKSPSEELADELQNVLAVAGAVPVIGEPADLMNAGIYSMRGKHTEAALSVYSMSVIPVTAFKPFMKVVDGERVVIVGYGTKGIKNIERLPAEQRVKIVKGIEQIEESMQRKKVDIARKFREDNPGLLEKGRDPNQTLNEAEQDLLDRAIKATEEVSEEGTARLQQFIKTFFR